MIHLALPLARPVGMALHLNVDTVTGIHRPWHLDIRKANVLRGLRLQFPEQECKKYLFSNDALPSLLPLATVRSSA